MSSSRLDISGGGGLSGSGGGGGGLNGSGGGGGGGATVGLLGTYQVSLRVHDEPFSKELLLISDRLLPKLQIGELVAVWAVQTQPKQQSGGLSGASLSSDGSRGSSGLLQPLPIASLRQPTGGVNTSPLPQAQESEASPRPGTIGSTSASSSGSATNVRSGLRSSTPAMAVPALNKALPPHALVFRVGEQTVRSGINFDLSLGSFVAKQFGLAVRTEVHVRRASGQESRLDAVELVFKDQYICRSDIWHLQRALEQRCIHAGESLVIGEIRAQVRKPIRLLPNHAANSLSIEQTISSGLIDTHTRFVFRSRSARFYILLQVSEESFQLAPDGYTFSEKMLNWCKALLERWNSLKRPHRDFYQTVFREETCSDWLSLLPLISSALAEFLQRMPATKGEAPSFAQASDGNLLEAINLALDVLEEDHLDKDITKTGQEIVIVSASSGLYNVPRTLIKITKSRMIANGIGCDLICLPHPPLHVVPLFRYAEAPSRSGHKHFEGPPVLLERFSFPYWIYVSYYPGDAAPSPPSFLIPVQTSLYQRWAKQIFSQPQPPAKPALVIPSDHLSYVPSAPSSVPPLSSFDQALIDQYDEWIFDPSASMVFLGSNTKDTSTTISSTTVATALNEASPSLVSSSSPSVHFLDVPITSLTSVPPIDLHKGKSSLRRRLSIPTGSISCRLDLGGTPPTAQYFLRTPISGSPTAATAAAVQPSSVMNPFVPYSTSQSRPSSGRGRFAHVFPEGYSPYLRKRDELYLSAHNWTSLVEPASLPLTSDYFPSDTNLRASFQVYNHSVVPLHEGGQSTLPELLDQLVAQRLEQGYQLVVSPEGNMVGASELIQKSEHGSPLRPPKPRPVAGSQLVTPSLMALEAMKGKKSKTKTIPIYRLSLSANFHALVFDVENQQIIVKQYRPQQNILSSISGSPPTVYSYSIWNTTQKLWHPKKMANRWTEAAQTVGWYNWSYVDQLVCGYEDDLASIPKYWRIRLALLPTLALTSASCTSSVQSFNRFMAEISRYSSSKGEESPVKIIIPSEFKDSVEGEEEIPLHAPRIQGSHNRLRSYQLREIVLLMQDPQQGVSVKTRRYGIRFYRECFLGSEAVSWLVENLEISDLLSLASDSQPEDEDDLQRLRAGAQKFGEKLMQESCIVHAAKKPEFLDGPFFYRFTSSGPRTDPEETFQEERALTPSEKEQQTKAEVFKAKINVTGARRDRTNPYQWILMHYDSVYSPAWPFSIEIHWLVSTGCEVSKFLNRLHRAARMQRMTFLQVPINQYVENDPFRAPSIFYLSETSHTRPEIEAFLTQKLHFIQNLRPSFQFVRPGSDQVEYVHSKGAALILLDSDYLAMNLNYTSRVLTNIGREVRNAVVNFWSVREPSSPVGSEDSPTISNPETLVVMSFPAPASPVSSSVSPSSDANPTPQTQDGPQAESPAADDGGEADISSKQAAVDEHRLRRVLYYLALKQVYYR